MATFRSSTMTKHHMMDFIDKYREMECLWNPESSDYHSRERREEAYDHMLDILQVIDPEATRETVVKKINSIRTSYRKELNKKLSAMEAGGEAYSPKLWYFEKLSFLKLKAHSRELPSGILLKSTGSDEGRASKGKRSNRQNKWSASPNRSSGECSTPKWSKVDPDLDVIQKHEPLHCSDEEKFENGRQEEVVTHVNAAPAVSARVLPTGPPTASAQFANRDDLRIFAEMVEDRLRRIPNRRRVCILRHEIEKLLFEAELEVLDQANL